MSGFVYAIGDGEGRVKIGWSRNPVRRLPNIQTACAGKATLLGLVRATKVQETEIHQLLHAHRHHGEWFWLRGPVLDFVFSLPKPQPREVLLGNSALKNWRLRRGLSLEEVAGMLGVTRTSVCRWEKENRYPRGETLKRLSFVTGLSVADLLGIAEAA